MRQLSERLKQDAVSLGLCEQWTAAWGAETAQQDLIDKYKRGIDFCIKHQYPANEFIKLNFDPILLRQNKIFIDEHIDIDMPSDDVYIFNGSCSGTLHFRSWSVATLYVRHASHLNIIAEGHAKIFVRLYDGGSISYHTFEEAKVFVRDKR